MEKFSWDKFIKGFGSLTGWFKALAIGLRVVIIVGAVLGSIWAFNSVKSWLFPKKTTQAQTQAGVFTGSVGQVTYSQPVNVDYTKILDIVESRRNKAYLGVTGSINPDDSRDKSVGIEGGLLF